MAEILRISAKNLGELALPDFCLRCAVNRPVACCLQRVGMMVHSV